VATFDAAQCETCHRADQAEFVTQHVADFGHDCLACHDGADRFSGFDHNRLTFALSGEHSQIACGQCHAQVRAAADFASAAPNCVDCHRKDDAHNGAFGADCGKCHTSDSWEDAKFDHNLAAFKLVGQHQTVECARCHVDNVFKGTPQTCAACHLKDDHHQGAFGTDCAQCHNPSDWKDAKFDHNLAAFKLTGAHVDVPCAQCHVNGVFKGTPQTCVSCHAEPQQHLGAFGTDCAQCHTTTAWRPASFDHNTTKFALTGKHLTATCQSCHVNGNYQLVYTDCYQCHLTDFQRPTSPNHVTANFSHQCQTCHTTATFRIASYTHGNRELGYFFAGKHASSAARDVAKYERGGSRPWSTHGRKTGGA